MADGRRHRRDGLSRATPQCHCIGSKGLRPTAHAVCGVVVRRQQERVQYQPFGSLVRRRYPQRFRRAQQAKGVGADSSTVKVEVTNKWSDSAAGNSSATELP